MTDHLKAKLVRALLDHFGDDERRIEHAMRVTAWAERIWDVEGGDQDVILCVGLLHDVGIKEAEAREGSASGKLQEKYGPGIVRRMLEQIGLPEPVIVESCAIVANHHTPAGIPGPNFPVLWDADMLVNIADDVKVDDPKKMESIIEKSFRTKTGMAFAR
jgi:HD superfamily phosphodiesterase